MSTLKFANINKIYSNNYHAVYDFNLEVKDKEFIVLVGPSGCGKSTTLRMLAGLEDISSGEIYIDDVLINDVAPKDRNIAMVFQNYALYPHMTVFENMAFSLRLRKNYFPVIEKDFSNPEYLKRKVDLEQKYEQLSEEGIKEIENEEGASKEVKKDKRKDLKYKLEKQFQSEMLDLKNQYSHEVMTFDEQEVKKIKEEISELKNKGKNTELKEKELEKALNNKTKVKLEYRHYNNEEIAVRVLNAAKTLGLEQYLKRKPAALSGGQRQRVALGRAIVRNPKVFLMDEPLSNLDAKLRVQMRSEISKIHQKVNATTVYVTHDQTEAMTMADRIVCMKGGYVQQIGTPYELFNNPENMFVAGFIGAPATNFIKGMFDGSEFVVKDSQFKLKLNASFTKLLKEYVNKPVILGVRPEDMYVAGSSSIEHPSSSFELQCDISELLGRELIVYSFIGENKVVVKVVNKEFMKPGEIEKFVLDMDRIHFFDPETERRIR